MCFSYVYIFGGCIHKEYLGEDHFHKELSAQQESGDCAATEVIVGQPNYECPECKETMAAEVVSAIASEEPQGHRSGSYAVLAERGWLNSVREWAELNNSPWFPSLYVGSPSLQSATGSTAATDHQQFENALFGELDTRHAGPSVPWTDGQVIFNPTVAEFQPHPFQGRQVNHPFAGLNRDPTPLPPPPMGPSTNPNLPPQPSFTANPPTRPRSNASASQYPPAIGRTAYALHQAPAAPMPPTQPRAHTHAQAPAAAHIPRHFRPSANAILRQARGVDASRPQGKGKHYRVLADDTGEGQM